MSRKEISVKDAANILHVSVSDIHTYVKEGKLGAAKKKGRTFVFYDEVQKLARKNKRWHWLRKKDGKTSRLRNAIVWVFSIFVALGLWEIIGEELYEAYVKPTLRPPIVVFPKGVSFDRSQNYSEQKFYVENRSSESHYNIEILVYIDELEKEFENVEIKKLRKEKKDFEGKQSLVEMIPEEVVIEGGTLSFKDGRPFKYARIERLGAGDATPLVIIFRSIRKNSIKNLESLQLPIEVNKYSNFPMITASRKTEELPYFHIKIRSHMSFNFQRKRITVIIADNNSVWLMADDVCKLFGIGDVDKVLDTLDYYSKTLINVSYKDGSKKKKFIISSYGMRKLVSKSTKPIAEEFQKWVSDVVEPQVKKS